MFNAIVMYIFTFLDRKNPVWANLVQKFKVDHLKGTLKPKSSAKYI